METYLGNEGGAFHPACLEKELLHPHSVMGEEALLGEKGGTDRREAEQRGRLEVDAQWPH